MTSGNQNHSCPICDMLTEADYRRAFGFNGFTRRLHALKIESEYYQLQEKGIKNFEVRKNDRKFQVGDMIYLKEVIDGVETGRILPPKEITYILHGGRYGLKRGYCVLQLSS